MYEAFYGFSQPPFGLSPDVHFCFRHRSYSRARGYMQYAVSRGEGFLVVTGRPGMGKTTLIQDLLGELGSRKRLVARIDSTQLDAEDLLRLVAYAFGVPARGLDKATLVHSLAEFLGGRPESAGTAILIVDEAQNLSDRSLEELRLITNLQRGARALIQIFLVGQESLRDLIRQRSLEQLQQRIVAACHLDPLDLTETRAYIRHRLLCAGWSGDPVYEAEALRHIYEASGGVPRLINKICDRLLLHGSVEELHSLRADDARLVIAELKDEFLDRDNGDLFSAGAGGPGLFQSSEIQDLGPASESVSSFRGLFASGEPAETQSLEAQAALPESEARGGLEAPTTTRAAATAGIGSPPLASVERSESGQDSDPWGLFAPRDHARQAPRLNEQASAEGDQQSERPGTVPIDAPAGSQPQPWTYASIGYQGHHRKRRPNLWPYAAAAALLLGVAGYLVVLPKTGQGELGAKLEELLAYAAGQIKSLQRETGSASPPSQDDATRAREGSFSSTDLTRPSPERDSASRPVRGLASDEEAPSASARDALGVDADTLPTVAAPSTEVEVSTVDQSQPSASTTRTGIANAKWLGASNDAEGLSDRGSPQGSDPAGGSTDLPTLEGVREPFVGPGNDVADHGAPGTLDSAGTERLVAVPLGQEPTRTPAGTFVAPGPALESELRQLGLGVRGLDDGRLSFDLAEEVPFAFNSAQLPDKSKHILGQLAEVLIRNPSTRITVVGHTDSRGAAEYNRRLSLSRARAVAAYLRGEGVSDERISTQGVGKDAPLPDQGGVDAARQRRVEIIIQPAGE